MRFNRNSPAEVAPASNEPDGFRSLRYGRLDSLLNDDGGDQRHRPTWMNFGLWGEELQHGRGAFSSACAALARAVADKARMSRQKNTTDLDNTACAAVSGGAAACPCGAIVLDLGCGCGDQLQLWVREFGSRNIIACTPEQRQVFGSPFILPLQPHPACASH